MIIDSLNAQTQDVTGVFDESYNQMFRTARPMKANVKPSSKLMVHPIEDGALVADHKVFDSIEIELTVVLGQGEYRNTYSQIAEAFRGSKLFTVQTKVASFPNMTIESMPHEETPDLMDEVAMQIKLKEVRLVKAQFETLPPRKVERAADADTKKRGEQTPTPTRRQSKLDSVFGSSL